jgi:hypothetical protein
MKQEKISEIALNCYAIVSGNFATFCNPQNRGENFSWSKFPEMEEKRCRIFIWMYMAPPSDEKLREEIAAKAAEFGREIAATLVDKAEFV